MKKEIKSQLKGVLKAIAAIAFLGIAIGVGYATTVITDEGIWVDGSAVIVEGDYNDWTHQWTNELPEGVDTSGDFSSFVDDINDVVTLMWYDDSGNARLGIYTLSDFSVVFLSGAGYDYIERPYSVIYSNIYGVCNPSGGGSSRSLQTYLLIARSEYREIEIFCGGSQLWTHNVTSEVGLNDEMDAMEISSTGKYILIKTSDSETGANDKIILYEGS